MNGSTVTLLPHRRGGIRRSAQGIANMDFAAWMPRIFSSVGTALIVSPNDECDS